MLRRHLLLAPVALAAVTLTGCAAFNTLTSDVTSYGQWPEGRAPGRFFIERLPSQAARSHRMEDLQALETAARQALLQKGFAEAADAASSDVIVQVGARITRYDTAPWTDPLWWRWGSAYWRSPLWAGPRQFSYSPYWRSVPMPEREVAVLLRDRATSLPLWESRAASTGNGSGVEVFSAMFTAALSDFPQARSEPHAVGVPLTR